MAFADGAAAIKALAIAGWTHGDVPLYWANDVADEIALRSEQLGPFVHVDIVGGLERPLTRGAPGANTFKQSGEIVARIFTVAGKGDAQARGYADDFAAIFRDQVFAGVSCGSGAGVTGGGNDGTDGNWFQIDVIIPFMFFHTA